MAKSEWQTLKQLHDTLQKQKEIYRAYQVAIQVKAGEAWIQFTSGQAREGLDLMKWAAAMEDSTTKHPVTPGEVLPARELYADMLNMAGQKQAALENYLAVLQKSPNRFNSLYGVARTAKNMGKTELAANYYNQLLKMASPKSDRPELTEARAFSRGAQH
jgi:tetratricopeptide (TPR) repeat protein